MSPSIILKTATQLLVPVMMLFSVHLLIQGHFLPGGGFAGGLMAAGAYALYATAKGIDEARRALPVRPVSLLALGLACSLFSGLLPLFKGKGFLKGMWTDLHLFEDLTLHLGTPLLFDVGVYFVVVGAILMIVFELEDVFARKTEGP